MTQRHTSTPLDHIEAEFAAFPFASTAAFEQCLTHLDPRFAEGTGALWSAAESTLLRSFSGMGVEEARALRDRLWFTTSAAGPIPLAEVLRARAHEWLERRGPVAVPRLLSESPSGARPALSAARARWRWRWISLAMPGDLVVAALPLASGIPCSVELVTPAISRRLEDGFAETHLHLGAALHFNTLWIGTLCRLRQADVGASDFQSPGAEWRDGEDFGDWLIRAAIARVLLAAYWSEPGLATSFEDWLTRALSPRLFPVDGMLARLAVRDLLAGRLSPGLFGSLRPLYYELSAGTPPARELEGLQDSDPVARFVGRLPSADTCWISRGLDWTTRRPADRHASRVFWQVIRCQVRYYRHVVLRPMTPGLPWFIRAFDRARPGREGLSKAIQVASAIRLSGRGLRSLEVRTSPYESMEQNCRLLREVAAVARPENLELGVVLHLIKPQRAASGRFGARTSAEPVYGETRYARLRRGFDSRVTALEGVLEVDPELLDVLRGFDVCTDERAVPTWVVAPFFRRLRAAGDRAAGRVPRHRHEGPALHATAHVGEDFVHLLGGLRAVAEAMEHLCDREGDRLGHATALGVDASAWARTTPRVLISAEERLFDLLWLRRFVAGLHLDVPLDSLEIEARYLAEQVFGHRDLDGLSTIYEDLQAGQLHRPDVQDYLGDRLIFHRGQLTRWVETEAEGPLLVAVQKALRREVAARGLTVEVNPTSNLLIGNLGELRAHPLWRFVSPEDSEAGCAIRACIGSDDPVNFASALPEEYQLLWDALLRDGVPAADADRQLDRLRRAGLDARFTRPPVGR